MKKWILTLVAVATMMFSTNALARPLTLNEISESICRVTVVSPGSYFGRQSQSKGTGTCIGKTQDGLSYYILTNAHVVGNQQSGTVEFFKGGRKSRPLAAKVEWREYQQGSDKDFAVLTVPVSAFGGINPRVIPLAPEGYEPITGNYIAAAGCPEARWSNGWEGFISDHRTSRVMFQPPPVGGQSGTGITVLIKGKDGELHTRVGAILTWRVGDPDDDARAMGAAIPVSTLYSVLKQGANYQPYMVPTNYHEAAQQFALGNNGKLYPVYRDAYGHPEVNLGQDHGVQIISWDYKKPTTPKVCCPHNIAFGRPTSGCPNGTPGCPGPGGAPGGSYGSPPGGSFGFGRPSPGPQPTPVPPYRQEPYGNTPPPSGGNPYGVVPPSIGAPWPGSEDGGLDPILEDPKPDDDVAPGCPSPTPIAVKPKTETETSGIFSSFTDATNNFFGGIVMGGGLGLLVLVWNKFLKKRVIKKIDSLQDLVEDAAAKKWGKEKAAKARDLMEGAEEALLGFVDDFLEDDSAREQVAMSIARGKTAERITNGSGLRKKVTKQEILEAINVAAKEVGDESVTTAVPAKVDEILARVAKNKAT
jgi:hypothetical protein